MLETFLAFFLAGSIAETEGFFRSDDPSGGQGSEEAPSLFVVGSPILRRLNGRWGSLSTAKRLQGRVLGVVNLGEFVEANDVGADAHFRV